MIRGDRVAHQLVPSLVRDEWGFIVDASTGEVVVDSIIDYSREWRIFDIDELETKPRCSGPIGVDFRDLMRRDRKRASRLYKSVLELLEELGIYPDYNDRVLAARIIRHLININKKFKIQYAAKYIAYIILRTRHQDKLREFFKDNMVRVHDIEKLDLKQFITKRRDLWSEVFNITIKVIRELDPSLEPLAIRLYVKLREKIEFNGRTPAAVAGGILDIVRILTPLYHRITLTQLAEKINLADVTVRLNRKKIMQALGMKIVYGGAFVIKKIIMPKQLYNEIKDFIRKDLEIEVIE